MTVGGGALRAPVQDHHNASAQLLAWPDTETWSSPPRMTAPLWSHAVIRLQLGHTQSSSSPSSLATFPPAALQGPATQGHIWGLTDPSATSSSCSGSQAIRQMKANSGWVTHPSSPYPHTPPPARAEPQGTR